MEDAAPRWPRVLIVSPPPMNLMAGGGVTMHRLLGRWPADRLAQIYSEDVEPDSSRVRGSYRTHGAPRGSGPALFRQAIGLWQTRTGKIDGTILTGRLSASARGFVEAFRPEAVLLVVASTSLTRIARQVSRELHVPLISYVPDDWMPGYPQRPMFGGRLGAYLLNRVAHREVRQAFADSAAHLAISDAMAREYWVRYGYDFLPVYNSVDLEAWPLPEARPVRSSFRVVYSGSIFDAAQRAALRDVRDAVRLLRERGLDAVLEVYSAEAHREDLQRELTQPPASTLHPLVPASEVRSNLQAADVLVMPLSFDEVATSYMRLSMPGKLAEFMASGTPILSYGPAGVVQVHFVREHEAGLVVDHQSVPDLADALDRLRVDAALRERLARRAREVAQDTFSLPAVRARMERVIFQVVNREAPE